MCLTFPTLGAVPHMQILPNWAAVMGKEQWEYPKEINATAKIGF